VRTGLYAADMMARHYAVLACMAVLVTQSTAASVSPGSAPSMLKLRSNLRTHSASKLTPRTAGGAEYFTSPVDKDEEMFCLRMRLCSKQRKTNLS